jgi:hypothetical protein
MKFGKSLSFIFNDEYWFKKITLPALCGLIPLIGGIIVLGWSLKVAQNVMDGVEEPLPEFKFSEDLERGFSAWGIDFLYNLPVALLALISQWQPLVSIKSTEFIVAEVSTGSAILNGITTLLVFVVSIFTQPAIMNFLVKSDFKAGFKFDEIWNIFRSNPGDWILVILATFVMGLFLPILGLLACIIGFFFVAPIISAASAHLMAQAYLRSQNKSQTPELTA